MKTVRLIVAADEPALFFSSVTAAEGYLEAVDVKNGVYTAVFGPNGESFLISANGNQVLITASQEKILQTSKLKSLLLKFLEAIDEPCSQENSLSDLIRKCEPHLIV